MIFAWASYQALLQASRGPVVRDCWSRTCKHSRHALRTASAARRMLPLSALCHRTRSCSAAQTQPSRTRWGPADRKLNCPSTAWPLTHRETGTRKKRRDAGRWSLRLCGPAFSPSNRWWAWKKRSLDWHKTRHSIPEFIKKSHKG